MQSRSAKAELHIFESPGRTNAMAKLEIFRSPGRIEVWKAEFHIFANQSRVEVWERSFSTLEMLAEQKCGS